VAEAASIFPPENSSLDVRQGWQFLPRRCDSRGGSARSAAA